MSLINISNLTFSYDYGYNNVFEDVSFQIDTDWKLGFTGRNGRGKTTFLNLLLGKYKYTGNIATSVEFEYFPFKVADKSRLTAEVAENICEDLQPWQLLREMSLLEISEDALYMPFNTLSSGEQTKFLIAALFLKENKFLLIDEPTNHLDMHGRKLLCDYLNSKKGFILVSHDRTLLDGCIDHVLSINKADIEVQRGNFSTWLENKTIRDNFELAENEKLRKEVARLKKAAARTSDWSDKIERTKRGTKNSGLRPDRGYIGHKSAKMMARSKAIEERSLSAVKEKTTLLKNIESCEELKMPQLSYHSDRLVLLEDVAVYRGGRCVCDNVSFTVGKGERIALCGSNGCGKSSVLKLICGDYIEYTGNFQRGRRIVVSYVAQEASDICGMLSDYARQYDIDESLFKTILRKLDFSREQFEKDMSDFSGGQKKKVLIARSLCEKAHLYIWDEPLNYIDVISRMQIEKMLVQSGQTVIFVEHDSAFCDNVATKKVYL